MADELTRDERAEDMPDWWVCDMADKGYTQYAEAAAKIRGALNKPVKERAVVAAPFEKAVKE